MAGTIEPCVPMPNRREGLNGVRPRWPEQSLLYSASHGTLQIVSMESGLDGRNNGINGANLGQWIDVSMESGLDGRNNRSCASHQ